MQCSAATWRHTLKTGERERDAALGYKKVAQTNKPDTNAKASVSKQTNPAQEIQQTSCMQPSFNIIIYQKHACKNYSQEVPFHTYQYEVVIVTW